MPQKTRPWADHLKNVVLYLVNPSNVRLQYRFFDKYNFVVHLKAVKTRIALGPLLGIVLEIDFWYYFYSSLFLFWPT